MLKLNAEQAREVVLAKYPDAVQLGREPDCVIFVSLGNRWTRYLSGYCKTPAAAWISAARRIEKGK